MNKDSTNMSPEDWERIANEIERNYNEYDGFVVLHGTDTMAYTSAALYPLFNRGKPIAITGSMKPVGENDSDAPKNFNNAIAFAISGHNEGVFIVFGDEIIIGNKAVKMDLDSTNAFDSKNWDLRSTNSLLRTKLPKGFVPVSPASFDKNVIAIHLTPGLPVEIFESICKKVHGVVLEVFGEGGLPDELLEGVKKVAERIPVVLVTQVYRGSMNLDAYDVGINAKKVGVIDGKDMSVEEAVTKLMYFRAKTDDVSLIKYFVEGGIKGLRDYEKYNRKTLKPLNHLEENLLFSAGFSKKEAKRINLASIGEDEFIEIMRNKLMRGMTAEEAIRDVVVGKERVRVTI